MTTLAELTKDLAETVDLELSLHGGPVCEDNHIWNNGKRPLAVPECGLEATHIMVFTCPNRQPDEPPMTLICQPLTDWLAGQLHCATHESGEHGKVVPL